MSFVNVTSRAALAGPAPSAGVAAAEHQSPQIVTAWANLIGVDIATSPDVSVGRCTQAVNDDLLAASATAGHDGHEVLATKVTKKKPKNLRDLRVLRG